MLQSMDVHKLILFFIQQADFNCNNNMNHFEYPSDQAIFRVVRDRQQLKRMLKSEALQLNIKCQNYLISSHKNKYIYCKCSKCPAQLRYFKQVQEQHYHLIKFKNKHQHKPLNLGWVIQEYIKNLPTTMEPRSMKELTKKQFNISNAKFYYHHRQVLNAQQTFQSVINELDELRYESRYLPFPLGSQCIPDLFITSSRQMIRLFNEFGDCVSFDVTYNMIKQSFFDPVSKKNRKWGIGFLSGKNNNNKPIIFSVILLNTQTTEAMRGIMESIFKIMNKQFKTLISDQQQSIISALDQLKQKELWDGDHFLDIYHIIKNLRKKIKNEALYNLLHEAILTTHAQQYQVLISKARKQIQSEAEANIFKQFLFNSNRFCYSKTPPVYQGLSLSTSYHEKLHDRIKDIIKYEKPANYVLRQLLKFANQINAEAKNYKICKIPYQKIFQNYQLKLLRFSVCQKVFEQIIKIYAQSLSLIYHQNSQSQWIFRNKSYGKDVVKVDQIKKLLVCSCLFQIKSGLPCEHLIKIIIDIREEILNYVSQRWRLKFINKNDLQINQKRLLIIQSGRPRLSRRNTQ